MYRVLKDFRDLQANEDYKVGDAFPHNGKEVAQSRLRYLSMPTEGRGALIEEAAEAEEKKPKAKRQKAEE